MAIQEIPVWGGKVGPVVRTRVQRQHWQGRLPLLVLYIAPLLVWILLISLASTQVGNYQSSGRLMEQMLRLLGATGNEATYLAYYPLNMAARRLAQVGVNGVLTLLIVRAVQWGHPRMKWQAIVGALSASTVLAVGEVFHRRWTPNRHGDMDDLMLNTLGSVLALALTGVWFAAKHWEQHALEAAQRH